MREEVTLKGVDEIGLLLDHEHTLNYLRKLGVTLEDEDGA